MLRCTLLLLAVLAVASASAVFSSKLGTPFNRYDAELSMISLYYSKATSCKTDVISSWTCGVSCAFNPGVTSVTVYSNETTGGKGFTAYNPHSNQIVIAFRGSSNIQNWIEDLVFTKIPYAACTGCEVHKGFWDVYQSMEPAMLSSFKALHAAHPSASVLVTGHSLGAAVGLHAALALVSYTSNITIYNFGDPRVGNPQFAEYCTKRLPAGRQFRVTHAADPVPHLPPMSWGFLHAPHELWYDNNGNTTWRDCVDSGTAEDPLCADSVPFPVDIDDHLLYLGVPTGCSNSQEEWDRLLNVSAHRKIKLPKEWLAKPN